MTTITKPDLVLRVAVAGQRELPEATRAELARRLDEVYGVLGGTLEAVALSAGKERPAPDIAAYYSVAAPVLRLLTGLADGADQLAATTFVADQRGPVRRTLAAVLPFDAVTYRDRSPVEDKQGFDTLLAECEHVIELDGRYLPDPPPGAPPDDFPKRCRARAYRAQAAVLLRQCDLVIAIADPAHQGRAGGTRETTERALALDIPVLFLPVGTDAVTLIGSREALEPEPDLALRTATPDWQEALRACVTDLVAIPALGTDKDAGPLRESERAFLDEFFSEVEHRPRLRRRRLWEWFARRFKDPGKAQPGSDPPLDPFRVYRARATEMNYLYIGLYRGSFLLNYVLAVVAVTLAVLGLIVLGAGGDHTAILAGLGLGKLAVLAAILRNTHAANHHDWNDKAIDYRYLAERLRAMFYLPRVASLRPPAPGAPRHAARVLRQGVVDWLFQALVRQAPPAGPGPNAALRPDLRAAVAAIRDRWIENQIRYHHNNADTMGRMHRRLEGWGSRLNWVVIVAVAIDLLILGLASSPCLPEDWAHRLHAASPWLLFLAAVIPAAVASLNGIRFQSECRRLAERSAAMEKILTVCGQSATELGVALAQAASNPDRDPGAWILEALALAEDCGRLTVDEVAEWSVLYAKEVIEP